MTDTTAPAPEKPEWSVKLPIAGYIIVEVRADDEAGAIEAALNSDYDKDSIEEWSTYRVLVEGNVVNVSPYRADAIRID